jgi:hypothetical protein
MLSHLFLSVVLYILASHWANSPGVILYASETQKLHVPKHLVKCDLCTTTMPAQKYIYYLKTLLFFLYHKQQNGF